jgi:hypothetical protein
MFVYEFAILFRKGNKRCYLKKKIRNKQKFEQFSPFIRVQTNSKIHLHLYSYNLNCLLKVNNDVVDCSIH